MRKDDYYRRTMHTPDDPARAAQRATLREISRTLLPLHRALIEAARAEYDATVAPVTGPNHLLQLLGDDPFFTWLKPITALIVDIDEMVRTDYAAADAEAIAARVQRLFGNDADETFAVRYVPILQRDVDVAIGHAAVRQALGKLVS
ncbi:MAG: hypothetical protein QOH21_2993 [Acidobacteriota bacterium]|jgi:hypothetical protein|nr:hypothetical protein [Acidobacteriota bacterium]